MDSKQSFQPPDDSRPIMLRRDFKEDENMPQSAPLNMKPTATARIHMLADGVLPWDMHAVDATTQIRVTLAQAGTPIGSNDAAIAGHALATQCVLVTNNVREFQRVPGLNYEDWTR
jgi:predicted nucleic acid-binding protein